MRCLPLGEGCRLRTLKRRLYSSFLLACDASLLQIEFALDPATRFISNSAIAEQLVDEFPLGSDQLRPELRGNQSHIESI